MGFKISDISEPSSQESPITKQAIQDVIEKHLSEVEQIDKLNSTLLKELSKKSSKHKFIVQSTKIEVEDTNIALNLDTRFGAVWEPEKDGYLNIKLESINRDTPNPILEKKDTFEGIVDAYTETENKSDAHPKLDAAELYLVSVFWIFVG